MRWGKGKNSLHHTIRQRRGRGLFFYLWFFYIASSRRRSALFWVCYVYVYLRPLWPLSERVFITATTRGGGGEGGWHLVLRNGPEFGPTPTSRDVPCAAAEEEKRSEEKVIEAAYRGKNSPRHFVHRQKDILPSFWPPEKVKFNEVPFSFFSFTESFA